jgi:hypothetical protein
MAYSTAAAVSDLKASLPWLVRSVSLQPLDGLFDGQNAIFHLPVVPANPDTPIIFYDNLGQPTSAGSIVSYDTGVIRFLPGQQPFDAVYVSYEAQLKPDSQLINLCRSGFRYMETRFRRNYHLVESAGVQYISSDANQVVDPLAYGERAFSQSEAQVGYYLTCCEYALLNDMMHESADQSLLYREERMGGLMVDRSKQMTAYKTLLDEVKARLEEQEWTARQENDPDSAYGTLLPGAQSDTYRNTWDWWSDSEQAQFGSGAPDHG